MSNRLRYGHSETRRRVRKIKRDRGANNKKHRGREGGREGGGGGSS